MFTQCPDCGTVFRVTATVLRAARGQVRCGVCDATFDALQFLTEEPDAESGDAPVASRRGPDDLGGAPPSTVGGEDFDDGDEDDDDREDEFEHEHELADAETEERILDATYGGTDETGRHEGFPLEELDDPIDVIANAGGGPAPEFPPFDADEDGTDRAPARTPGEVADADPATDTARHQVPAVAALADRDESVWDARDDRTAATSESGHFEIAIEDLEDAASTGTASPAATPAAATSEPEPQETPAPIERFERRAGRNTPSADEDRALAEIAAALARRAQSAPASASTDLDEDAPSLEIELLDPSAAENIVLAGGDDVPDSALEFNLPVEEWDRVFVPDEGAATIPPLDPTLARAQSAALADGGRDAHPRGRRDPLGDDDVEIEFEGDADEADDDGDLDEDDLRERERSAASASPGTTREDPLSRTDEFPPLRVTLAEEAAAGLADTPDAKPRTGVAPEDFDALVAAAAARAAAEVAARVGTGAGATTGAGTTLAGSGHAAAPMIADRGAPAGIAAAAGPSATTAGAGVSAAPLRTPIADGVDGTAENAWFTARRDLAPEGAPIASIESPETIQFDAQRFQAIVRGRRRRPLWRTVLYAIGSLVLALGLGAQAVHYYRESLAQHPIFGAPLREAYARLGLPLEPRWNLGAYEVKQWGATSDVAPGTLRVRASIVNRAARAQPHPLLRVTLLDRFSAKVARREFAPAEYLPGRTAPAEMLPAGARVDADLVIADPGSDAVGFELDVCLKRRGVLECAGDAKLAVP